jgi:hypothetical protein
LFYCAWGTHGIPDPTLYQVPLRSGSTVPAVITFAKATREAPMTAPHAVARSRRHSRSVLSAMLGALEPSHR